MAWSGGTYTKGNNGTGGWVGDASLGIGIEAGRHDTQDNDFATGINQCLNKDGSNAATGNLNLGGFKITNMGTGTLSSDATTLAQVQSGINTQSTTLSISNTQFSADTTAAIVALQKSRGATVGTNTIVASGDSIGSLTFAGANGTSFTNAAAITAQVDGTPGASNDMPGRLVFSTTADGSGTLTERMRIDNGGRTAINGSTTSPGNTQFYAVSSTASRAAGRFYTSATGDDGTPTLFLDKQSTVNTTAQVFIQCTINAQGTAQGQINANGASQLAFGTFSDQRLKENIEDLPNQLDNIVSLRPVEFDYKNGSGHQIGFIAQEVQTIYPDLVNADSQGMLNLSGLGKWEARLVKAIQELNAKVEALEAKIIELEAT